MAKKKKLSHHVDRRILLRARIFAVISIIFIGILVRDLFIGTISWQFMFLAILAGGAAGMIASRTYHLSWDKDGKKVIGRLDGLGIAVLVLYILFAINRQRIVGLFIQGPMLGTVTIGVMAGLFIGQIVSIRNGVKGILKDEGVIK